MSRLDGFLLVFFVLREGKGGGGRWRGEDRISFIVWRCRMIRVFNGFKAESSMVL